MSIESIHSNCCTPHGNELQSGMIVPLTFGAGVNVKLPAVSENAVARYTWRVWTPLYSFTVRAGAASFQTLDTDLD